MEKKEAEILNKVVEDIDFLKRYTAHEFAENAKKLEHKVAVKNKRIEFLDTELKRLLQRIDKLQAENLKMANAHADIKRLFSKLAATAGEYKEEKEALEKETTGLTKEKLIFKKIGDSLIKKNKILEQKVNDRNIIIKELAARNKKLEMVKDAYKRAREMLISKEVSLKELDEKLEAHKQFIVELRKNKLDLEIISKSKAQDSETLKKRLDSVVGSNKIIINKLLESKKILETQISMIKKEKDEEIEEKRELQMRVRQLVLALKKQKNEHEAEQAKVDSILSRQRKKYEDIIARMNQTHTRDMIEKNTAVLAFKKRLDDMKKLISEKNEKEKTVINKFTEELQALVK